MARPGLTTIKTLFALSCNRCAFPGCDERLTDPLWSGVRADIAHIRGEKAGAARYAPEMTDEERNAVDNLMLLCPNHHREIDRLRPKEWPADKLMDLKATHERDCGHHEWAGDATLEHIASLLASMDADSNPQPPTLKPLSRLVIEPGPKDSFHVANVGDIDALDVSIRVSPDSTGSGGILHLEEQAIPRLSPGGRMRGGLFVRTMSDQGLPIVRVRWCDPDGEAREADFPMS